MRRPLTLEEQQIKVLRVSLRSLKSENATLKRQNARLLSTNYQKEAESEIARLTRRIIDVEAMWEDAERELNQVRLHLLQEVAA